MNVPIRLELAIRIMIPKEPLLNSLILNLTKELKRFNFEVYSPIFLIDH